MGILRVLCALWALGFALALVGCGEHRRLPINVVRASAIRQPYDPELASKEIEFHVQRVKADPKGAIGWAQLSAAYLKRARETQSHEDAESAERAALRSLTLRRKNNVTAANLLVKALLEHHEFPQALAAVEDALKIDPQCQEAIQLRVDVLIELGRYREAKDRIIEDSEAFNDLGGKPVVARLAEIEGRAKDALATWRVIVDEASANPGVSCEAFAWHTVKLASLMVKAGVAEEAREALKEALRLHPKNYKAWLALGQLELASGNAQQALQCGQSASRIVTQMDVESLIGEAFDALGDDKGRERQWTRVISIRESEVASHDTMRGGSPTHTHDRQFSIICIDWGRNLPEALALAQSEIKLRQDDQAWETLAWARYRLGKFEQAEIAMINAEKHGIADSRSKLRSGLIKIASGDATNGQRLVREALKSRGMLTPWERSLSKLKSGL